MTPTEAVAKVLEALDPRPERLGVAVSGGSDSLALLHLTADWARVAGVKVHAVTVDHRLRPEASDEARLVSALCARLGSDHQTLVWEHGEISGNVQDQARRARLGLVHEWAAAERIGFVLLGHTRDDQAETFLLRLARGSGVDGLSAIPAQRTDGAITWLRPLLACRRDELRNDLRARGIAWVEDPSNEDEQYDRVRARKMLEGLQPLGLGVERLAETADRMAQAREALEIETLRQARLIARVEDGDVVLSAPGLAALPDEIRHRLLAHSFRWVAVADYVPRATSLAALWSDLGAQGVATLHGCVATMKNDEIRIAREWKAVADRIAAPGAVWDGRWRLSGPETARAEVRALGEAGLQACANWRKTGRPRRSLLASPAVWSDKELLAAPLAGMANGWTANSVRNDDDYFNAILSH